MPWWLSALLCHEQALNKDVPNSVKETKVVQILKAVSASWHATPEPFRVQIGEGAALSCPCWLLVLPTHFARAGPCQTLMLVLLALQGHLKYILEWPSVFAQEWNSVFAL